MYTTLYIALTKIFLTMKPHAESLTLRIRELLRNKMLQGQGLIRNDIFPEMVI